MGLTCPKLRGAGSGSAADARHPPGTCPAPARHLPGTCPAPARHLPGVAGGLRSLTEGARARLEFRGAGPPDPAIRSPSTRSVMSLYQRARDILAAKTNKALDAAEKPDEMLDLSYEQMLDQITKIRQALV